MRRYALLFVLLLLISSSAAAEVNVDIENSQINLSGTVSSGEEGVSVGIDIFCPNKSYADLKNADLNEFKRVIIRRDQTVSDADGRWSITFKIKDDPTIDYDARSGKYTAVIFSEDSNTPYTEEINYVNLAAAQNALNRLASGDDIEQLLKDYKADLGIDYPFINNIKLNNAAKILAQAISDGMLDGADVENGVKIVRRAVIIQAISDGDVKNLFDYEDILSLEDSPIGDFCDKDYIKINQSPITELMKGNTFNSFDEFNEILTDKTILAVVQNPDGIANIAEIVDAFHEKIGVDANLDSSAYRAVMGKRYQTLSALSEELKKDHSIVTDRGGGGGKSSGGSGKGSVTVIGTNTNSTDENTVQPINYDIFDDLQDASWAADAICYLAEKRIVAGSGDMKFHPNDSITREELAKILVDAFAPEEPEAEISFIDTDNSKWYYSYIQKAVSAGIIKGFSDTEFGVGKLVTREDMATMIYRAALYSNISLDSSSLSFSDADDISEYARDAVGALSNEGIVNGIDLYNFAPKLTATRAQAARIIYGLLIR